MALKAGRVGLNTELVDEFGYLKEDAPSGEYYTKTQADNKFATKTHVNNNFQKKNLDVPIEMLSGSKLTVESALQGLNEEKFDRAEQVVLGAKNLLPNNAKTQTINGVTFTVNDDGSVTANGTATANTSFYVLNKKTWNYDADAILSSCPENGSDNSFRCQVYDYSTSQSYVDYGEGVTVPKSVYGHSIDVFIRIANGYNANNVVFYPMLRFASDPDDTYVPYAMTNKELTDMFPSSYKSDNLTMLTGCSYVAGGYVKIGNIVVVDVRIKVDEAVSEIGLTGLPTYAQKTLNNKTIVLVQCTNHSDDSNAFLYANVAPNGKMHALGTVVQGKEYGFSGVYLCD